MEVMSEAEVFVETAFGKMTDGLDYHLLVLLFKLPMTTTNNPSKHISEVVLSIIFGTARGLTSGRLTIVQLLDYIQ